MILRQIVLLLILMFGATSGIRAAEPRTRVSIDEKPLHDTFGMENARLIAPGHPDRSVLLQRVAIRGRGQMPQLATSIVDRQAVELLRQWIQQLEIDESEKYRPRRGF